jgi:sensor histidine kinase YesM
MITQGAALEYFFQLPFLPVIADALISWLFVGILLFFITNTLSFYHPRSNRIILIVLAPLALAVINLKLTQALTGLFVSDIDYLVFLSETWFYRFTVFLLLFAGTIIINLIWYELAEKEDHLRRKEETSRMVKDAELMKLRQQLQPHFLFNSLNSINSLIGSRPSDARSMLQQLSDFLRRTVKREDQKLVSLKEELDYLKLYLSIEQLRFGHRLKVEIAHSEDCLDRKIPTLILQPLLENAIKFGLYGTVGEITVRLECKLINQNLHISLENPFDRDSQAPSGTGFGLSSVQRRLYLLYGRKDLLQTTSTKDDLFRVFLKIP